MIRLMKRGTRGLLALIMVSGLLASEHRVAEAGSGLNQFTWSAANLTVSSSSYRYSNMSGFVQALVNSNACTTGIDGNFGPITTWNLAVMQNGILGYNNGGVMDPGMWQAFQFAGSVYGPRLDYTYTDGYATEHWTYYGGGSGPSAEFGWNSFGTQWFFSPTPASNPSALFPATPNRTIGSYAACA